MDPKKCVKPAFVVIGKEGSTQDGDGSIQKLWQSASAQFAQVQHLAKKDANGNIAGIWGAMSDLSRSFLPWENHFSEGLYLAGVECLDDAEAPAGWTKWTVPGYEYLYTACEEEDTFSKMLDHLDQNGLSLAGAVQEFTCPQTGTSYLFFPIRKL